LTLKDIIAKNKLIKFLNIEKIPKITRIALLTIGISYLFQYIRFSEIIFVYKILIIIILSTISMAINKNYLSYAFIFIISTFMYYSYFVFEFNFIKKVDNIKTITGIVTGKTETKNKFLYTIKTNAIITKKEKIIYSTYVKLLSNKNLELSDYIICKNIYQLTKIKTINDWEKEKFHQGYAGIFISNTIKKYNESVIYQKIYRYIKIIASARNFILNQIKITLKDQPLFKTIFLGESNKNQNIKQIFNTWGITHYLARSGLHIQILISFISFILLFLGINYKKIIFFESFILLFFYFFSFQSISFLRAIIMFLMNKFCLLLKIKTTSLHIVSATALLIFFINPYSFFLLSTQLTFFCTFILAVINYKQYQI
jgi:competence protein ComEC